MQITFNFGNLVILFVLGMIIFSHTFGSCCHLNFNQGMYMLEGFTSDIAKDTTTASKLASNVLKHGTVASSSPLPAESSVKGKKEKTVTGLEGFTNYASSQMSNVNTKSWFTPSLEYTPGKENKEVKSIFARKQQTIPLPKGQLSFFAKTPFSVDCCKNGSSYTTSDGCACMTVPQYSYLQDRGGNNVPYSEY
jgi:hypothetical protein